MIRSLNTFKLFHHLHKTLFLTPKIDPTVVRHATTDKTVSKPDQEKWTEIYRLPLIRLAAAFNRLKVYQALVTAVGSPAVFALEEAGHLDPNFGVTFAIVGVTGVLTLTICSFPVRNLIGFVYMNDEQDKVKLGYVDFWGKRRNQELVIDDILADWELPPRKINIYQPVKTRKGSLQTYKLLHRYGIIRDPQRYVTVFGEENK